MLDNTFKIIYFIEFILITIVRTTHTTRYRMLTIAIARKSLTDMVLMALSGIGMAVPLVFLFSSLLDFANYRLPDWVGWLGAILFALAIWLLWRSHVDLGRNWTPTLGIRDDHQLVTDGVFRYLRHPMYAAHILWAIAAALMLHNWVAGYTFLVISIIHYVSRVKIEEHMMIEHFGARYESYMRKTGRIIPRFSKEST
jgi:protein-S-isoprenylcysteine O-methyltransferase Ste14